MNATNPPPAAANPSKPPKKQPAKPSYPHFVDFAEKWLLPLISVRLAEGQRENTYTWCEQWWEHRPVAVRIAHLHAAFEASRGPGASAFVGTHVDAHFRVILDAAKGPLHRCTPREHIETPWLPSEPVPADKTGPPPAGESETTPPTSEATDKEQKKPPPPPRFAHHTLWVRQWLLPVTAVRISGNHRENTYTWCTRWFEHHGVELRFALLHRAFEAAVIAEDKTAMSSLFTRQIDPAMRLILDAANGPLHRCKPGDHQLLPSLGSARVPRHWFGPAHARIPTERLGFAPDFRAYRTPGEGGSS
ncbi:DUF4913 domain-containing protein [Nocardia sp. NBC_01377]|uniref:DUF4913 domain-containing protein n=1 Tax=Nocardia sp. NBC_01377 TaxID=2903595 RepID=UPI00324C9245